LTRLRGAHAHANRQEPAHAARACGFPGGTYWKTWDKNIREHLLRNQLISPDDLNLYRITDNTDEAVKIITRFYRNFQSTRFVRDLLVIRLKNAPADSALAALNEDFADIINGEPIKCIKPTLEEIEGGTTWIWRASRSASTGTITAACAS